MNRRSMLRVIVGGWIPMIGCLSGPLLEEKPEGVILTRLSVDNNSKQHHDVMVTILYDGETVHSQKYHVEPREGNVMGGQILDIPRAESPGRVEIRASMDDHQERVTTLHELYDEGCVRGMVFIEESGEKLTFLLTHKESGCSSESPSSTEGGTSGSSFQQTELG